MYHPFNKNSSYVRDALYKEYKGKCIYCGGTLQPRYMHIDHILPTNRPDQIDEEVEAYIHELAEAGFVQDSIENYLPSCAACNIGKSNTVFNAANLRYYHEIARKHVDNLMKLIEQAKKTKEYYYEPVNLSCWEPLDFKYQRGITHAIMGYRLSPADVKSCPTFPQVKKLAKRLALVDYAWLQGETGCGKSISLFQTAFLFYEKGWDIYLLKNIDDKLKIRLPNNTENTLYIIDDAQIYSNYFIDDICSQARSYRKILLARTITDSVTADTVMLTNRDSIEILYRDFWKRKNDIWPIVRECDQSIGVSMMDTPIEHRLNLAKKALTPWQFTYILRGGWNSMREVYFSVTSHNHCDLLAALIASLQILTLDKPIDYKRIFDKMKRINPQYRWTMDDIHYLICKRIVLSEDDIRIVHLESASVIVALFFDCPKTEKQDVLLTIIEDEFKEKNISPLGVVWLCNGYRRNSRRFYSSGDIFLTEPIIKGAEKWLQDAESSEEVRDSVYLIERIIATVEKSKEGINLVDRNQDLIVRLVTKANSISVEAFKDLFNTLYNQKKDMYRKISRKIDWTVPVDSMLGEVHPNYYAWGRFFNRGLSLVGKNSFTRYGEKMVFLTEQIINKASENNIEQITFFICSITFIYPEKIYDLMSRLLPVYQRYFKSNMRNAVHIFDFEFLLHVCGINLLKKSRASEEQQKISMELIKIIPNEDLSAVISDSMMQEWFSIRNILYFIGSYNREKYVEIIKLVNLETLSVSVNDCWDCSYEMCMILGFLMAADFSIAKTLVKMNLHRIKVFFPLIIVLNVKGAIERHNIEGTPLELFDGHHWEDSLEALKALKKENLEFTKNFLNKQATQVSKVFNEVTALDFEESYPLDLLKLIRHIDYGTFSKIVSNISEGRILDNWDRCAGVNPKKRQWIEKRKIEFLELIQ